MDKDTLHIAALADIHCSKTHQEPIETLLAQACEETDVLLLGGDLTDYGLPEEAKILAKKLSRVSKIPMLAVFGNHDWEAGHPDEVRKILRDAGVIMLEGDTYELHGVGFAGTKGFGGGFGRRMLEPWGEPAIKEFVKEAIDEALRLESGLAKLDTNHRVVLLHYAPIAATVEGEPSETFPFLGSSRLEEPINRYGVDVVFHGHAHHGSPEGKTREGIPVYNVAVPLLKHHFPDRPPFRRFSLPIQAPEPVHVNAPEPR